MKKNSTRHAPHRTPRRQAVTRPPKESLDLGSRLGLTQKELGLITGKSPSYYRRLAKLGLGPRALRMGGRGLIYPVAAVKEWLERNAIDPADVSGR